MYIGRYLSKTIYYCFFLINIDNAEYLACLVYSLIIYLLAILLVLLIFYKNCKFVINTLIIRQEPLYLKHHLLNIYEQIDSKLFFQRFCLKYDFNEIPVKLVICHTYLF